jgi:hypothetical protein
MPNHENLQAVCTLIAVWAALFFGVLAIPQYVPSPWNCYLAVIITVGVLAFSAVYFGYVKGPDEQQLRRRENIHNAIKEWVDLPTTRFCDQQDTLPLAEEPPESAREIEECLKRKYPSVWSNLEKLRQEYSEYKGHNENFIRYVNGRATVRTRDIDAYHYSRCKHLRELHDQLKEQITSEIIDLDYTRLKC